MKFTCTTPQPPETEEYFGGCPECGGVTESLNVGVVHWRICEAHGFKWSPGWNLFSSWREEGPEIWEANSARLREFLAVRPVYPKDTQGGVR